MCKSYLLIFLLTHFVYGKIEPVSEESKQQLASRTILQYVADGDIAGLEPIVHAAKDVDAWFYLKPLAEQNLYLMDQLGQLEEESEQNRQALKEAQAQLAAKSKDPFQVRRVVVLIANDDYTRTEYPNLRLAEKDALTMASVFSSLPGTTISKILTGRFVSKATIEYELRTAVRLAQKQGAEEIVVFASGHGFTDRHGDMVYVTGSAEHVALANFATSLERFEGESYILLDACLGTRDIDVPTRPARFLPPVHVMTAAKIGEVVSDHGIRGCFSKSLETVFKSLSYPNNLDLDWNALFSDIQKITLRLTDTQENKADRIPWFFNLRDGLTLPKGPSVKAAAARKTKQGNLFSWLSAIIRI